MSKKIICSFSGGKTSAFMAAQLKKRYGASLICVFMNTGLEHPKTYEFIEKCNDHFGLKLICLEPVLHHKKGVGTTRKVVNLKDCHKGLDFFLEMVKKYGLMGPGFLHCTRELKLQPFKSYLRYLKLNKNPVAIGIRADEIDRMDSDFEKKKIFYPLVKQNITKEDVNAFWRKAPFTLNLPEHLGNCVTCWKKSDRKLYTVALEYPQKFMDLIQIEEAAKSKGADYMFRKCRSARDILREAQTVKFETFVDDEYESSCKESCEVFTE